MRSLYFVIVRGRPCPGQRIQPYGRRTVDFWQTVKVVFRRWYITFPAFLAALGVAGLVYGSVPTQYVSTSVLLLTTPTTGPTEDVDPKHPNAITNPLLNFE